MPRISATASVSALTELQQDYPHLDIIEELITNRGDYMLEGESSKSMSISAFPHFLSNCVARVNAAVALKLAKAQQRISKSGQRLILTMPDGTKFRMAAPRGRQGAYLTCQPGTQAVMRCSLVAGMNMIQSNEKVHSLVKFKQDINLRRAVSSIFSNEVNLILSNWMVGVPDPKMSGVGRENVWLSQDLHTRLGNLAKELGLKRNVLCCLCMAYAMEDQQEILDDYCNDLRTVTAVFDLKVSCRLSMAASIEEWMNKFDKGRKSGKRGSEGRIKSYRRRR